MPPASCFIKALHGRIVYDALGYPAVEAQIDIFVNRGCSGVSFFAIVTNPQLEYAPGYYSTTRDSTTRDSSGRHTTSENSSGKKAVGVSKPGRAPPYSSRFSSFEYDAKLQHDWINSRNIAETAVTIINDQIRPTLLKQQFQLDCVKQALIDHFLNGVAETIQQDQNAALSDDDETLPTALSMATMAVSMAACRAGAHAQHNMPLYHHIAQLAGTPQTERFRLPVPHIALLGGGARAGGRVKSVACRSISILPVGCKSFLEAVQFGTELFKLIKSIQQRQPTESKSKYKLSDEKLKPVLVLSDEGTIIPQKRGMEDILKLLTSYFDEYKRQQQLSNFSPVPSSYKLSLHIDADAFFHTGKSRYYLELPPKPQSPPLVIGGTKSTTPNTASSTVNTSAASTNMAATTTPVMSTLTADELFGHVRDLLRVYPIISLIDLFAQQDLQAWRNAVLELKITLPSSLQIAADRFIASQPLNINQYVVLNRYCSAASFRLNQVSTVSELVQLIEMMRLTGTIPVAAQARHETEDTFICDAAVGFGCGQIKLGAPVRGENIAKYNRLIAIEDKMTNSGLKFTCEYAGNNIT